VALDEEKCPTPGTIVNMRAASRRRLVRGDVQGNEIVLPVEEERWGIETGEERQQVVSATSLVSL
jgi:hypothetical protein